MNCTETEMLHENKRLRDENRFLREEILSIAKDLCEIGQEIRDFGKDKYRLSMPISCYTFENLQVYR